MTQEQQKPDQPAENPKPASEPAKAEVKAEQKATEAAPAPAKADPAADLAALIAAAVQKQTGPLMEQGRIAAMANEHGLTLSAAQHVADIQRDNPKLSFKQALTLAREEFPNDFDRGFQRNIYSHLPVGGESVARSASAAEKTTEQKYDEAIDLAHNGANGSKAAGAAVMRSAVKQYLEVQIAKRQGVYV